MIDKKYIIILLALFVIFTMSNLAKAETVLIGSIEKINLEDPNWGMIRNTDYGTVDYSDQTYPYNMDNYIYNLSYYGSNYNYAYTKVTGSYLKSAASLTGYFGEMVVGRVLDPFPIVSFNLGIGGGFGQVIQSPKDEYVERVTYNDVDTVTAYNVYLKGEIGMKVKIKAFHLLGNLTYRNSKFDNWTYEDAWGDVNDFPAELTPYPEINPENVTLNFGVGINF